MKFDQELTLLSEEEIWGVESAKQLDVLKKYGTISAITDLAILTGNFCDFSGTYMAPDDNSLKGRAGCYSTRSSDGNGDVRCVRESGIKCTFFRYNRDGAIRPALQSSKIFDLVYPNRVMGYNGTEEVEYGEYPQYAPSLDVQELLEQEFRRGYLHKTGKNYTFDSTVTYNYSQYFQPVTYDEYEYKGKKFIRIKLKQSCYGDLSNGKQYERGDYVWVEVSPVRWLIDDKTKTLLSKRGILSGIRFHTTARGYNGDFSTTDMKEYLKKIKIQRTKKKIKI